MNKNEVKLGAILSYVVIALNMIIGLAYTPILIKMLGQSEYGLYSLVSSLIGYLTLFDLGFGNAIIIYTARYKAKGQKEKEQKLHGMFLIIYTVIGIIAGIAGSIVYLNINNVFGTTMTQQELNIARKLMIVLMANLVFTFPFSIFISIITAYEKFIFSKILNILRIIAIPLIMIPLLLNGHRSLTMVIVTTVLNLIVLILNMIFCLKKLHIKFKFGKMDFNLLKEVFAYSVYIFLNVVIDKINWTVDQFVLGAVSGTIAVSIYSVAAQINAMYLNFSTAISGVLLPKVTKMEANDATDKEFTDIFIKTGRLQYIVMALIMSGFIIFGQLFINIWAGENYSEAYIIGCILMIPVTIPLIQNVGLSILQAKNKYKYRTIIFFFIAIANIIISIPLAKRYGGIGSAIGTAISLIIGQGIILNIYYYKKIHINIPKFWKEIFKVTIPVLGAFIIGIGINKIIIVNNYVFLLLKIIIYSIIYILLVWKFGINDYEKQLVKGPFQKIINKLKR